MTVVSISGDSFPSLDAYVQAKWAPIILEPIAGSYEKLVVGCAVVNENGFHLEIANALDRLHCLYGSRSESVAFAVKLANDAILRDLAERGLDGLKNTAGPLSGIHIGPIREAEGTSLEAIAKDWMAVLSSLYHQESGLDTKEGEEIGFIYTDPLPRKGPDRLPQLVLEQVSNLDISLVRHFSERIVLGRRPKNRSHELDIDYKGKRLVANFATLNANRIPRAVGNIKQRLWDLKIEREEGFENGKIRDHELIIQVPRPDDPQITRNQVLRLESEYNGLLEQADKLKLVLREFNTASQIGNHIIKKEAA